MTRCKSVRFLSVLTLLLWLSSAEASHFRFGSIAWSPTPGSSSSNTVTFYFRLAFRRSFSNAYYCDENTKLQGSLIGYGDTWRAACSGAYNPQCSIINLVDTGFYCTDFSSNEDWSMGENNFTYTFPSYNRNWTVSYTSCCWISLARYGGQWLVSGKIDLTPRSDNGKINSSPVTRSLAIVRFQEGCPKEIRIPVEDPDGDTVKCRWASDAESSIPSDSFPYGLLEETTCVLKYGGGNGTAGTYAATLTLEDFPAGTTNFDNVRPFSAVGLQFLVIISGQSGPCDDIPVFTDSTPEDGECSEIQIGSAYTAVIEVQLADFAKHVVEITTSSPPGMQITPLRYHQGVYYRNVTWYPSQYQFGQNLFCFQAVDSSGLQSSLHCVTILVGLSNTPQVILGSQWPMNPLSEFGPGLIWWRIQFDRVIKKPRSSAYIRLVLQPSSYTVYKVDTLSQYVIIDSNRTVLHFATPKAALSMNGSYAILIDHGAVVGQGCSYDGPPTPGITSPSDWGFPVDGVCPVGSSLAPPGFTSCVDVDECASHSRSKRSFWWWPYLFSTSTAAYSGSTASASSSYLSECYNHSYLEDSVRGMGFYNGYYGNYQCDYLLPSGWYRFRGAAGTEMPTSCVGKNRCSSHAPGWLNGSHPSVADGAVNATVCFHWNWGCCSWSTSIRVRNCSGFYVYELGPPPACWLRYCGNGGANYSTSSVISPTPVYASATPSVVAPTPDSCSYNLTGVRGNFTSRDYPQHYAHDLDCSWTITVSAGYYIYLHFEHFHLEDGGTHCPYDYVQIFDGSLASNPITTKRCAYQDSWCVYSHSNVVTIILITDGSVSHPGFSAYYERVYHTYPNCSVVSTTGPPSPASVSCSFDNGLCTGWSQSTSDVFDWTLNSGPTSSGYTGPSSDLSGTGKYIYTEASSPRSSGDNAKLQFVLPRGSSSSCLVFFYHMYGYSMGTLNVFNGNTLIFTASGDHGDNWRKVARTVNSNYVLIFEGIRGSSFTSDIAIDNVTVSEGNCPANYSTTSIPSTTVISPTPGSCSHTLTGLRGNFTSPNYPYDYPLSVTCNWTISVAPGYFIYMHFEHFHLEHAWGASECPYDFVEIFDGSSSSSPLIAKRCDYQDSWCVYSTSHVLHVKFVSDVIIARSGFSAYYERVHTTYPTCLHLNSTLHSRAVFSTSASYSTASIPSTTVISPTPGQTVSSSLVSQYPSECFHHSYLEDADRGVGFSGYSGYCDNNLPSGWYRFRGAAGTEMPTSCVGTYRCGTQAPGWLNGSHPSVADGAVHATVCFHWGWAGCCAWPTSIRVRNCSGFYVYELGPPLLCNLRYCGNGGASYSTTSIPSTTVISPTPASISPTTSASTTPVSPGSCSYTLTGLRGNFTSPNYPYDYPLSVTCNWTITVTPGYFIYMHFEHFHLEHAYGVSECPFDFVEIFDGSSSSSPLIAKRCDYQDSWCVYSTSNVLHVNFVSDYIVARSGFSAYYQRVHTGYPMCLHPNSTLHSRTGTSTPAYFQATSSIPVNGIHPTPASAMPSSFYAASSVNVLPNPSQFELHLPSGCEQICSNTYGSYTCSCVSGYQLAPDGKSCLDIDECSISNGGCSHHCFNIPGSFYCGCPEGRTMGANNLTCVEPGVSVDCGDSNMTVALEKRTFPFFEVGQLHLRYSSCRATQNDTHLLVSTTLNGCGTLVNETQDALIFWNEIQADAVIIDYVITRTHDIKLPFYCSYSRRKMLSLSFTPQPVFFLTEAGYGNLTFKIDFYKSSSFITPYSQQDYPLVVELNDYVYVRYSVESSADLTIMAVTCKATKTGSSYSWPQYTIIQNGCPRDTTMDYSYDPLRNFQQFKIKAFRFFDDYDTVYFHCELLACHKYSPNSRCNQGCSIGNKRKKRDVTRDEVEHEESTNKVVVTQGPVVFKKEEQQQSGDTEQNKQTGALIGGAAAAGGFGLIAFIALAVLFVKYRIARRFMNRNKVGDLYTTQDEQMSRKHAYIQEDDMIDNDDTL